MTAVGIDIGYQSQPNCLDIKHIPGDTGLPYLGKIFPMIKDFRGVVEDHVHRFGHVSRFSMGGQTGLLITHADHLRDIYLDRDRNFSPMMGYAGVLGRFYGGGLLMRDFENHRVHRRIFQNSFKNNAMKGYVEIMNPTLDEGMSGWDQIADFHFFPQIKELLLDVASRVFIGVEELTGTENEKLNRAFLDIAEKGLMAFIRAEIPGLAFAKGMKGKRYLESYLRSLIAVRRAGDGKDTMSMIVKERDDEGNYWPDADLVPHLSFLLFAAHDTTTSALNHMLMYLGKPEHHHIQEELRQFSLSLNKPFLEYEDLDQMTGLDNCFMEGLRLYPSVSLMTRRTVRECELGGYRVPANTLLFVVPQWAHRDPEIWTNPNTFDPDRWGAERAEQKNHSFGFVGFGGGAHKCIGMHFANMQVKLFMHRFLQKYRFSTPENYAPWMQTIPLPKPGDNLPLRIERIV